MKRETPRAWINRILREKGLTHAQAAKLAKKAGHKLSSGYVHNIAAGKATNPSVKLIKAIAAAAGRTEDEAFEVFRGRQLSDDDAYKESLFAVLWSEYRKLPQADQDALRITIDMLQREIERRLTSAPTAGTRKSMSRD